MKVLLVNTLYYPSEIGGAERVVRRLADSLGQQRVDAEVACLAANHDAATSDVDGVTVHRLALRNVYPFLPATNRTALLKPLWHAIDSTNVLMARALDAVIDAVRPDLVHTHNLTGFSPLVWASIARRRLPIVHTLHDHYLLCARSTMFFRGENCASRHLFCAPYSAARLRHSSMVNAVVGVSRYILDRHLALGAFASVAIRRVVRNPVFVATRADADQAPGSASAPLRIGFLGRLEAPKGVEQLLAVCETLSDTNWSLDVAGTGDPDYEERLKSRWTRPNVRFLGRVDSSEFLRTIDVLAVPSIYNEQPLVVAEAFASGVPVIASNAGGTAELVDEGRTGFVVSAGTDHELRTVLERAKTDPGMLRAMRPACLAAAAQFTPALIAGEYAQLYREVVGST